MTTIRSWSPRHPATGPEAPWGSSSHRPHTSQDPRERGCQLTVLELRLKWTWRRVKVAGWLPWPGGRPKASHGGDVWKRNSGHGRRYALLIYEDLHENDLVLCSSATLLRASRPFRLQIFPFWHRQATHPHSPNSLSNQPLRHPQNLLTSIRSLRDGLQGNLLFPFPSPHRHHPHRQTKEN